jgi:hypothetical protein
MIEWLGDAKPFEVGTIGRRVIFDGCEMEAESAIYLATEILIAARSAMFRSQSQSSSSQASGTSDSLPSSDSSNTQPLPSESVSSTEQ